MTAAHGSGAATRRRARSAQDKEARRRQILEAAKVVFSSEGFHGTTIAHVAAAAGLSYGSVYWYFASKEDLFHALLEAEQAALRECVAAEVTHAAAVAGSDPLAPVRAAIRATFEFFEADPAATKLLFRDSMALGGGIEKHLYGIFERFIGDIERSIATGQQAGVIADAPAHVVAFSVASLIGQLAQRRTVTDDGLSAEEMADFVVWFVMDGLRPRRP